MKEELLLKYDHRFHILLTNKDLKKTLSPTQSLQGRYTPGCLRGNAGETGPLMTSYQRHKWAVQVEVC
ncbi:hypothetical protein ScPMuIL_005851 [Solemya velum]